MSMTVKFGRGDSVIIDAEPGRSIPPITFCLNIRNGSAQTYLSADEAAVLGTRLLEAATSLLEDEATVVVGASTEEKGR